MSSTRFDKVFISCKLNVLDQKALDAWLRSRKTITSKDILAFLKRKNVGGSTWVDLARMFRWHGFVRTGDVWHRDKVAPVGLCPTYRQLKSEADARRKRCKAALDREAQPTTAYYDPLNHDPEAQAPK